MRESAPLVAGQVIAEKYRIDAVLGEGGMGVVVAATNVHTERRVAIKRMQSRFAEDTAAVQRFLREAKAVGRIDHPNVVDIYDVGQDGDVPFLVMELLQGIPLSAVVGEEPLAPRDVVRMLMPALRGIHAVHERGLVHRDLKPDNIFLCQREDGTVQDVKVLDFGISKATDETLLPSITKTGALLGTPHYMSPEQIRGIKEIDRRADLYALGVILYEALTAALPFRAATFTALAVEVATGTALTPRERVPELDPALERAVLRAIARDRSQRWPDVASLAKALEPFGAGARFDDLGQMLTVDLQPPRRYSATAHTLEAGSSWPSATDPDTPPVALPPPALASDLALTRAEGPPEFSAAAAPAAAPPPAAAPAAPIGTTATTGTHLPTRSPLPWIVGAIAALALLSLGIYALQSSGDERARLAPPRSAPRVPPPEPDPLAPRRVQARDLGAAAPAAAPADPIASAPPVEPPAPVPAKTPVRTVSRVTRPEVPAAAPVSAPAADPPPATRPPRERDRATGVRTEGVSIDEF